MKKLIRWSLNHIPRPVLQRIAGWAVPAAGLLYKGRGVECPVCGAKYRKFMPYGYVQSRPNALCPKCLSLERHRLLWLYLTRETDLLTAFPRTLHIAPEVCIMRHLKPHFRPHPGQYVTADLESPLADLHFDVQQIPLADGSVDVVICNHVSNVFGCVQPVGEMAALCAEAGVPFVLDASQSAGILPVRMDELHAAFIAMPGHKGLYGPQGTGSLSKLQTMPDMLPDRLESGTHNMPGIAGLLEGIRYVQRTGVETIAAHERRLTAQAVELLRYTEGIRLFWCEGFRHQTGVLSLVVEGMDCEELGEAMARQGVALRAGLHCAPLAHRTVGTLKTGTVRFSPSAFNTSAQVVQFAQILQNTLRKM